MLRTRKNSARESAGRCSGLSNRMLPLSHRTSCRKPCCVSHLAQALGDASLAIRAMYDSSASSPSSTSLRASSASMVPLWPPRSKRPRSWHSNLWGAVSTRSLPEVRNATEFTSNATGKLASTDSNARLNGRTPRSLHSLASDAVASAPSSARTTKTDSGKAAPAAKSVANAWKSEAAGRMKRYAGPPRTPGSPKLSNKARKVSTLSGTVRPTRAWPRSSLSVATSLRCTVAW
mmetsp:Transcript_89937/g.253671  ORF Transcript_89937/g.253671 Transcript_89937/m.253671 type:complete len:233 (-) Transcript_89937:62-760(-)